MPRRSATSRAMGAKVVVRTGGRQPEGSLTGLFTKDLDTLATLAWRSTRASADLGLVRGQISGGCSLMVSSKSRRLAAPVVVACVGLFGSAATAHAAGGLS